jgi:hypothetical protein
LLGDAIPLPLFIFLDWNPVGVGIFVNVFVEAVGVVGILNPDRGCSEVGVFALRFGLTIVGIFTVDNGCTFIGGSVSAANCCGVAIFAGRVYVYLNKNKKKVVSETWKFIGLLTNKSNLTSDNLITLAAHLT